MRQAKPRSNRGSVRKKRRERPELFFQREKQRFLDSRSYVTKGGRVRLFGVDKSNLRESVYFRSHGRCQAPKHHFTCGGWADEFNGHLAHREHGPRKTDTLAGTYWAYWACHLIEEHNPKPITVTKKSIRGAA